ncbi:hypothetical protein OF83DRAFT_485325 [Amylostereum chailletii]|nr:hypothetical protein OF83DRAFT_485325 [Amylostereum chailletii]
MPVCSLFFPKAAPPRPLRLFKDTLFAPADGKHYTADDFARCCAQHPLSLLPQYMIPSNSKLHRPPTVYYGYPVSKEKLMEVIEKEFPDAVVWDYPEPNSDDEEEEEEEEEEEQASHTLAESVLVPCPEETFLSYELLQAFAKRFNLPPAKVHALCIRAVASLEDDCEYILAMGSNHGGMIPKHICPVVLNTFDISSDTKPRWYLDLVDWRWTRIPKSKSKRSKASLSVRMLCLVWVNWITKDISTGWCGG